MARLERLEEQEQRLYEGIGAEELRAKVRQVGQELQGMVDGQRLTAVEKSDFLEQLAIKMQQVKGEMARAEADGKSKKAQDLAQRLEILKTTESSVKASDAVTRQAE